MPASRLKTGGGTATRFEHPRALAAKPVSHVPNLCWSQEPRQVRPEWNRLAELRFDAQGFGFAVAALSDGAFVDALRRLPLHAPGGAVVPLEAVALVPPGMAVDVSGAELYRGLGVVVLSGLLFSTVVTLTFLPALLVEVLEWRRRRAARPSAGSPSP